MSSILETLRVSATTMAIAVVVAASHDSGSRSAHKPNRTGAVDVHQPIARDTSRALPELVADDEPAEGKRDPTPQLNPAPAAPIVPPVITSPPGAAAVEQKLQGTRPAVVLVESFDGLGAGFEGPHGTATLRNPSDNSLAVGTNHIFQIVNTRMAIFTKRASSFRHQGKHCTARCQPTRSSKDSAARVKR